MMQHKKSRRSLHRSDRPWREYNNTLSSWWKTRRLPPSLVWASSYSKRCWDRNPLISVRNWSSKNFSQLPCSKWYCHAALYAHGVGRSFFSLTSSTANPLLFFSCLHLSPIFIIRLQKRYKDMVANLKKMDAALKQRHAAMIKTEQSRYAVCATSDV
jgi:hypothetical protein